LFSAVGKLAAFAVGQLKGQARFADAAGTQQRQQAAVGIGPQPADCGQFSMTADEGGQRFGQHVPLTYASILPAARRKRQTIYGRGHSRYYSGQGGASQKIARRK